ncbi:MAG: patatin family protein [Oscillospiraceae bacterium]|nr:patatin family protein [Oscillospiraceae bacterium]
MKTGLVLEGGGMRGMYTIGVLDHFLEQNINFDYVIGVSAGACNGISFVSNQKGRNFRVNTIHIRDKRYISLSNFFREGSLFGMDFLFDLVPNVLEPFDYDTFLSSPTEFVVGVTNVETGRPEYYVKSDFDHDTTALRASSSIPCFSPIVDYRGKKYLDGGTSDPIPFKKALADGCERIVVVLTRDRNYRKKPESMRPLYHHIFRKYPAMYEALDRRYLIYNRTLEELHELEREGKAIVIAPENPLEISRFENNPERLVAASKLGQKDAAALEQKIKSFLAGE